MLLGGKFLEYRVLADDPVTGQHLGIMLIELGQGRKPPLPLTERVA
jgi:multicomponent Na+:H+ antiporter subunit B